MKPRKLILALPFLLLGAGYFTTFSQLEVHPLIEVQLFLLPIQLGLVAYFLLWRRPSEETSSHKLEAAQNHEGNQNEAGQNEASPRGELPDDL